MSNLDLMIAQVRDAKHYSRVYATLRRSTVRRFSAVFLYSAFRGRYRR